MSRHLLYLALGLLVSVTHAIEISEKPTALSTVTITVDGPKTSETAEKNPFTTTHPKATFSKGASQFIVRGYFAADGDAAESGAESGNQWRFHFVPPSGGTWDYSISGISVEPEGGISDAIQVSVGTFEVAEAAPGERGQLQHPKGSRYFRWSGTGAPWLKGGADSPENFLAFADFDQTHDTEKKGKRHQGEFIHRYEPHLKDWYPGDPTWHDGKGKAVIGALNYLAGKGVNSVYMLPYNLDGGDGHDTWPWISPDSRDRFDVSKLDQWNLVFDHMDALGLSIHIILQETENDQGLDHGDLGPIRKLYLRELIARFAHHRGVIWNLGEENTQTTAQQKAMADFVREQDPYDHPIVLHTYPSKKEEVYPPLLGHPTIDGPSLQMGNYRETHAATLEWIRRSAESGHAWVANHDEAGPADRGADPDNREDHNQKDIIRHALWGNLLAGGGGAEWYFGYKNEHADLVLEDFRSRDQLWDYTRHALDFFSDLPVVEMNSMDSLSSDRDIWCFAKPSEIYVAYVPARDAGTLTVEPGAYVVTWTDPFSGAEIARSEKEIGQSFKMKSPSGHDGDAVLLLRKP